MTYCHANEPIPRGGVMLCTLLTGHGGTFHIDTVHNRSWPMPVHLHTPTGRTYCGAPPPVDRANGWTAYRSEATCHACLSGLS
jgi:hypothetical protein